MYEMRLVQEIFMLHFKVSHPKDLNLADGDYRVWVYDEDFPVRVKDGRFSLFPPDFDEAGATVIGANL